MPTLDLDRGAQTMRLARATAGVETDGLLLIDYKMRGAVKLNNALFKAALHLETPFVVYLNDDTIPSQRNWCKLLIEGLRMNNRYGMACPSGECSTTPQRSGKPGDPFAVHVVRGPLAWFCAAVRAEVFRDVGLFDEGFIHYGDESDWVQRAQGVEAGLGAGRLHQTPARQRQGEQPTAPTVGQARQGALSAKVGEQAKGQKGGRQCFISSSATWPGRGARARIGSSA